jgi:DHA2 family multidrug resistance protein
MVNRQAAMIAYLNDFLAMALACFVAIPLLFFVKAPKSGAAQGPAIAAADAAH